MNELEVFVAPVKLYWVELPSHIQKVEQVELLKKDVLLIPCTFEYLLELKDKDELNKSLILINMDRILKIKDDAEFKKNFLTIKGFYSLITEFFPKISILHTTHIDSNMEKSVKDLGLLYMETCFSDIKMLKILVTKLANNLLVIENKRVRSYLRLHIYPHKCISVNIRNLTKKSSEVQCCLKDMSINGMGFILENEAVFEGYETKDIIQVKVFFCNTATTIKKAAIMRISADKKEIGVMYDINDHDMVNDRDSAMLTEIIHNAIENILDKNGNDYDLDFNIHKLVGCD